ncbi:MAG: rod shape-determining protein MreD [Cyanobacteria bacterium KgW148]|nr:rod shape-determining protein MreD [Cyanobacteria bacterium KgW148]
MIYRTLLYILGMAGGLMVCFLLLPARLPGTTLMGYGTNWLLIWLVGWSLRRPVPIAVGVGICLGLLQDTLVLPPEAGLLPSHSLGLGLSGGLTAMLEKQRYIQEDFISVALIVFAMVVVTETVNALQRTVLGGEVIAVWSDHQRIALSSAVLTSLWSPACYFPLSQLRHWFYRSVNQT